MTTRRVHRIDIANKFRSDADMPPLLPAQDGPGGCKLVEGFIARPGIYLYADGKGGHIRELVTEDVLGREDDLATLGRAPVTVTHPKKMVTADSAQKVMHGDVDGEVSIVNGGFVKVRMALRTKEALDSMNDGMTQLSPGYEATVDETPGEHPTFGKFDTRQVSRSYNHVALCFDARGGDACHYRTDSGEDVTALIMDGYTETIRAKTVEERTFTDDDGFKTTEVVTHKTQVDRDTRFPGDPDKDARPAPFEKLDAAIAKMRTDTAPLTTDMMVAMLEDMKIGLQEAISISVKNAVTEAMKVIQATAPATPAAPAPGTDPTKDPNSGQPASAEDPGAQGGVPSPVDGAPKPPGTPEDPNAAKTPADPTEPVEGAPAGDPNAPKPPATPADPNKPPVDPAAAGGNAPPVAGTPPAPKKEEEIPKKDSFDPIHRGTMERVASQLRIDYSGTSDADLALQILSASGLQPLGSHAANLGAVITLDSFGMTTSKAPEPRTDSTNSTLHFTSSIYGRQE